MVRSHFIDLTVRMFCRLLVVFSVSYICSYVCLGYWVRALTNLFISSSGLILFCIMTSEPLSVILVPSLTLINFYYLIVLKLLITWTCYFGLVAVFFWLGSFVNMDVVRLRLSCCCGALVHLGSMNPLARAHLVVSPELL